MEIEFQEICIDHEIRSLILKRISISKSIFTTLYIYNRIFIIIRKFYRLNISLSELHIIFIYKK